MEPMRKETHELSFLITSLGNVSLAGQTDGNQVEQDCPIEIKKKPEFEAAEMH